MIQQATRRTRRRIDPAGVRAKVLDAAEALLAQRGYYGVTMREVSTQASMNLGTLTHHFPTKENLFREVVERRAGEYVYRTDQALTRILGAKASPTMRDVLYAYLAPPLELSAQGGEGWKNYMKMLAHAMNNRQHERFLSPVLESFDPLLHRISDALSRACPDVPKDRMDWAFFFVSATLIHVLTEAGVVDRQSQSRCLSSDLERILEEMVAFFAAGMTQLGVESRDLRFISVSK